MTINGKNITLPNYWYTIFSVALVLVLLGFFGMLLLQSNALLTNLKEKITIVLELKDGISETDIVDIGQKLKSSEFAKANSITYLSKEAAMDLLRADFGADFMQLDMINPLYNVYTFNIKAIYVTDEMLEEIRLKIKDNNKVRDVYYQENMVDILAENLSKIARWGLLFAGLFLLIAIVLIHNTMRLTLHSNRILIKNMELIGASWSFISRPFLIRSLQNGLISAGIAILVLTLLFAYMNTQFDQVNLLQTSSFFLMCVALLLLGVGISGLSTYRVVHKYLQMRLDDLY